MRNKKMLLSLTATLLALTSGCTSMNGAMREGVNPLNGEPASYANQSPPPVEETARYRRLSGKYGSPARMIARASVEEINLIHTRLGFREEYPEAAFDASYQPTAGGARINLNWTSERCLFPPGVYEVNSEATRRYNRRQGLAFIDLVQKTVNSTVSRLREAGMHRYRIEATFEGWADGLPIRRPLLYRGEYGFVRLTENTTLNGRPHIFAIRPGQHIDNGELAALRAVSLAALLHRWLGETRLQDRFDIRTTNHVGKQFRTVRVSIEIFDN